MARRVEIVLVDDLDGSAANETVTFSLDGGSYEIDLSESNATALREVLDRFVRSARKVQPPTRRRTSKR